MELFKDQYNDTHVEVSAEVTVKINFVVPKRVAITKEGLIDWFKTQMAILESGRQMHSGNVMQRITVSENK